MYVLEYLDSIIDGLRLLGGDQIKKPERGPLDPDDACMFTNFFHWKGE